MGVRPSPGLWSLRLGSLHQLWLTVGTMPHRRRVPWAFALRHGRSWGLTNYLLVGLGLVSKGACPSWRCCLEHPTPTSVPVALQLRPGSAANGRGGTSPG